MGNNKEREALITEFIKATSRRNRILWNGFDEALGLDITPAQREALVAIASIKGCHISDIANWLGVTNGAVTQLVDGLERHNVVKRQQNIHDARKVQVVITEFGYEKLRSAMSFYVRRLSDIFDPLDIEQLRTLLKVQETILSHGEKNA